MARPSAEAALTVTATAVGLHRRAVVAGLGVVVGLAVMVGLGVVVVTGCSSMPDQSAGPTQPRYDVAPYEVGAEVGTDYAYELTTHCGIRWARIDGHWWETDPLGEAQAHPPEGWSNPTRHGTIRILSGDRAEFVRPDGRALVFHPSAAIPPGCD